MKRRCLRQLSELNYCPAVLIKFAQDRVVLVTTESEAHTKLVRQPRFWDSVAIKFPVQEEVKCAIVPLDHFENRVCGRVSSSSAHAAPPTGLCTCARWRVVRFQTFSTVHNYRPGIQTRPGVSIFGREMLIRSSNPVLTLLKALLPSQRLVRVDSGQRFCRCPR